MKDSPTTYCPVPDEQQPLNEYSQLKESWFFSWGTTEMILYLRKIAWIWLWATVIVTPIAWASFPFDRYPVKLVLSASLGGMFLLSLVLVRLYLGWHYIRDRLQTEKLFYEESGWYDGQIWKKPESVLQRDRLIVTYQIAPILQRVQQTGLIVLAIAASFFTALILL
ncbi:MAG: CGLD27 family protein [Limnothrix sp. RL_2_0]|nr:CGLD27 family protein [Limnothrix sp. RL_2_0]